MQRRKSGQPYRKWKKAAAEKFRRPARQEGVMSRNNDPAPITYEEWHNAQDEIDRLRAEVEGLKSADANKDWLALVAENKRLRAQVAELKKEAEGGKGLVYFYDKWAAAREKIAILRAEVMRLTEDRDELRTCLIHAPIGYELGEWSARVDAILGRTAPAPPGKET